MRVRRSNAGVVFALGAVMMLGLQGCATSVVSQQSDSTFGPTLSVERFLNAANARDHDEMARLFGTSSGPVADTGGSFGCAFKRFGSWFGLGDPCIKRTVVELRMDIIARILSHEDYRIRGEERVPGREDPTTQITVDLDMGSRTVANVPFVVVKSGEGSWLVQEIALDRLTG